MASSDALLRRLLPDRLSLGAAAAAAALVAVVSYHLAELSSELFLVRRRDADQQQQQLRSVDAPCEDDVGSAGYTTRSLPGGRRVETPYGTIQVYEAGPHDGRRVLFVHGISTPCIALANIAARLAEDGCRVMLFDLFGRGLSSAPTSLPYNSRLYTSQIHLVLSSSPVSWSSFTLIGYSLGGALVANYASYFPSQVDSLVLIAPGGLLRPSHVSWGSKLMYSNYMGRHWPALVRGYVHSRLWWKGDEEAVLVPGKKGSCEEDDTPGDGEEKTPSSAERREQEIVDAKASSSSSSWPTLTVDAAARIVNHSISTHPGFTYAFVSSLQHAPIMAQQERWRLIKCPTLLLLGKKDTIIKAEEIEPDARSCLGDRLEKVVVFEEGDHNIPMSLGAECAKEIRNMWERVGLL